MSDIQKMINDLRVFVEELDWDKFHNPKDLAIQISVEANELLEQFMWKTDEEVWQHIEENREKVEDEVADIQNNVLLLVNKLNIDLPKAVARKLAKNRAKYPATKARGSARKYDEY